MARVYVSSTIADLKEEREAVLKWLRLAEHMAIESYVPGSETVREKCLEDVDRSDLYVLILGHRYGHQPEQDNPEKLSITQLEFRRAKDIPRVVLLRTHVPDISLSDLEDEERAPLVRAFRKEVSGAVTPAEFKNLGELITGLSTGVEAELEKVKAKAAAAADGAPPAEWLEKHLADLSDDLGRLTVPLSKGKVVPLDSVYVALQLRMQTEGAEWQALLRKPRVALTGEAGSGKSTLLRHVGVQLAQALRQGAVPGVDGSKIPVFLDLAKTSGDLLVGRSAIIQPERWLSLLGAKLRLTPAQVTGLLRQGNVQFLFDGLDEVSDPADRDVLVDALFALQRDYGRLTAPNQVIVACRS